MILAWLLLLTGLTISAVAIYYSVVGLAAIFSAAVIPIIVMGSALEVAKLVCASWLKANWGHAPRLMKLYMTTAVAVLMLITSMGIFGFLSKAHSDQSLVSGDVLSKISIYDEKIKTAKENIEANRKQLKQMDEAVDQVMARSTDEKGADKANAIRRSQQRDRSALAKDIEANQKLIATLNDEAAPIRAEVRKVEAEVGPLKYIAAFVYGETDPTVLEKAVTWVIITIIIVFDPLAVIMLLAAQMTFGWNRKDGHDPLEVTQEEENELVIDEPVRTPASVVTPEELDALLKPEPAVEYKVVEDADHEEENELDKWNKMLEEADRAIQEEKKDIVEKEAKKYHPEEVVEEDSSIESGPQFPENPVYGQRFVRTDFNPTREFVFNDSQWVDAHAFEPEADIERPGDYLTDTDSKKKSYMTKDQSGKIQVKDRT